VASRFGVINDRRTQSGASPEAPCDDHAVLRLAEQLIKDRAEFAQKGIARGRSIVAAIFDKGW